MPCRAQAWTVRLLTCNRSATCFVVNSSAILAPSCTLFARDCTILRENGYRGNNSSRYRNADLDRLIDRYLVTTPFGERMLLLGQIIRHSTEHVVVMGLFYDTKTVLVANRLGHVTAEATPWNAHEWTVR